MSSTKRMFVVEFLYDDRISDEHMYDHFSEALTAEAHNETFPKNFLEGIEDMEVHQLAAKDMEEYRGIEKLTQDVANFKSIAQRTELERARLEMQVEHIIQNAGWVVRDGKTYMEIRVADGADLSCVGTRRKALGDLVMEKPNE